MGILRYNKSDAKWTLQRAPSLYGGSLLKETQSLNGLTEPFLPEDAADAFFQSPTRATTSQVEFFRELLSPIGSNTWMVNRSRPKGPKIPYLSRKDLEHRSSDLLGRVGYQKGALSLERMIKDQSNLVVNLHANRGDRDKGILGEIDFSTNTISVFSSETSTTGRDRFTLAHELSHFFLEHGDFLLRERCEEKDFTFDPMVTREDISRLEFQANYLAAVLLMPERQFKSSFYKLCQEMNVRSRGVMQLYVDSQKANVDIYYRITDRLTNEFAVSRQAATIRLEGLGLILKP
jgi:Zn-dependent peptidase ImmA (M78 family)